MPEEQKNITKLDREHEHSDIKKLIKKNIELNERIVKLVEKNNKMLRFQRFFGWLKVVLILIPIILAYIYLPPFLEKIINIYMDFFDFNLSGAGANLDSVDLKSMTPDFLEKIK